VPAVATGYSLSTNLAVLDDRADGRVVVIVSELDGTLLDHETYSTDTALPALGRLRDAGIPLVLCTSKTRAELEPLRRALGNTHPFIVENGGGVFLRLGYFPFAIDNTARRDAYDVIVPGDRYEDLVRALRRASRASGFAVRGFADMSDDQVARETGMTDVAAHAARQREFDEPFVIIEADRESDLLLGLRPDMPPDEILRLLR
jgi:mannosyl-3-phosphoglycerate phosphatase